MVSANANIDQLTSAQSSFRKRNLLRIKSFRGEFNEMYQ